MAQIQVVYTITIPDEIEIHSSPPTIQSPPTNPTVLKS